jgi:hypothetical protein
LDGLPEAIVEMVSLVFGEEDELILDSGRRG